MRETEPGDYRSQIDDLAALRSFVAVVDFGSFSDAGRRLRVVPSTISKHIVTLEERIHGQLIVRSTKRLYVTELGRHFYDRCLAILHEVRQAEEEVGNYNAEAQGQLKVTVPTVFASHHLASVMSDFVTRFPKVRLDVIASTEIVDLIESGIDVAIRISSSGGLDPGLIAVKLAQNTRVFCASPDYLARRGTPASVADLLNHNCVVSRGSSISAKWPMRRPDGSMQTINVSGNYVADNGDLVCNALVRGIGISYIARFLVHEDLQAGRLVELFAEERAVDSYVYAVYPSRRNLPLKTRAFIDCLRAHFATMPAWAR